MPAPRSRPPQRSAAQAYGIVGRTAPELRVPWWIDADGRPTRFTLGAVRGRWVLLECFQNGGPGCHRHGLPTLQRVNEAFAGHPGVAVAGLQTTFEGFSVNTRSAVRALQLRYRLAIPMGHDEGDPGGDHRPRTMRDFRTGGTPWVVLVDPTGTVVHNGFHVDAGRTIEFLRSQLMA